MMMSGNLGCLQNPFPISNSGVFVVTIIAVQNQHATLSCGVWLLLMTSFEAWTAAWCRSVVLQSSLHCYSLETGVHDCMQLARI